MARRAALRLIAVAEAGEGAAVVDVATGTGVVALHAARQVGAAGRVLATYISERMLQVARERAAEEGIENIEFQLMDGAARLPEESFDAVLCTSALFSFPDIPAALDAWHRALCSGGTVAFTSFVKGNFGAFAWPGFADTITRHLGAAEPIIQQLTSSDACREALEVAGFTAIDCQQADLGYHYQDFEAVWREMTSSLFTLRLAGRDDATVAALKADLAKVSAPQFEAGPAYRPNGVILSKAKKPS